MSTDVPTPETSVPADEEPAARCPYCDRPFTSHRSRDFHVVEAHPDAATDDERAAYNRADEAEVDELFAFHMKIVLGLGLVYIFFVLTYMVVLSA